MQKRRVRILILFTFMCLTLCACSHSGRGSIEKDDIQMVDLMKYSNSPFITGSETVYDIRDFGEVSADTIEAAVSYVGSNGGGVLYIEEGTYSITRAVELTNTSSDIVTLCGSPDRLRSTVLSGHPGAKGDLIRIKGDNINLAYLGFQNKNKDGSVLSVEGSKCGIYECWIEQKSTVNHLSGIVISGSFNTLANCSLGPGSSNSYIVSITKKDGVDCKGNTVADSYFSSQFQYGVLVNSNDSAEGVPQDVTIARNVFLFDAEGEITVNAVKGCKIYDNMLDCTWSSVLMIPSKHGISDVEIVRNYMGTGRNTLPDTVQRTVSGGVVCLDSVSGEKGRAANILISDNYFWGGDDSIHIGSDMFTDITVRNNYFVLARDHAIYMAASVRNVIKDNILSSPSDTCYALLRIDTIDEDTVLEDNNVYDTPEIPDIKKYKEHNCFG